MSSENPAYVILGAGGGIGSATARLLAARGARLVLGGRRPENIRAITEELNAFPVVLDARRAEQVESCFEKACDEFGEISGAVNCVGSLNLKPADRISQEEWDDCISTNLGSAFSTVRAAANTMRRGGSVVLISSAAGEVGLANHEAIASAKAGVIGLVRAAAATYASRGLRFNCVAPGMVRTKLTEAITESDLMLKSATAMHPLGRIGDVEDVASAISFFLSIDQGWITGEVLCVDGGLANVRGRVRA